ncbi:MAG: hypothetical protein ACRDS1_08140 [Pseudonocardiaceae bacterium]
MSGGTDVQQGRSTGARSDGAALTDRRKRLALLVLCAAMFLDSLDVSLIAVALPSIEHYSKPHVIEKKNNPRAAS